MNNKIFIGIIVALIIVIAIIIYTNSNSNKKEDISILATKPVINQPLYDSKQPLLSSEPFKEKYDINKDLDEIEMMQNIYLASL